MSDISKHAFNAAVDDTLQRCLEISNQRGGEYSDTWAAGNLKTSFLDMVLREIGAGLRPRNITAQEKRLIVIASLCDVKVSRTIGPYKDDTIDDLINYAAALRRWLADYKETTNS